MKTFQIYGMATASQSFGEIEAETKEEAEEKLDAFMEEKGFPVITGNSTIDFDIGDTEYEIEEI